MARMVYQMVMDISWNRRRRFLTKSGREVQHQTKGRFAILLGSRTFLFITATVVGHSTSK
jgi:hypothetical protein